MYRRTVQLSHRVLHYCLFFFFNDTATTEIYTLSLHDALPIYRAPAASPRRTRSSASRPGRRRVRPPVPRDSARAHPAASRSEEHTSELQSRQYLVCRLLLEKKKKTRTKNTFVR